MLAYKAEFGLVLRGKFDTLFCKLLNDNGQVNDILTFIYSRPDLQCGVYPKVKKQTIFALLGNFLI